MSAFGIAPQVGSLKAADTNANMLTGIDKVFGRSTGTMQIKVASRGRVFGPPGDRRDALATHLQRMYPLTFHLPGHHYF